MVAPARRVSKICPANEVVAPFGARAPRRAIAISRVVVWTAFVALSGCAEETFSTDAAQGDVRSVVDAADGVELPQCDDDGGDPCEPIEPSWPTEDAAVAIDVALDATFRDGALSDGALMDAARDSGAGPVPPPPPTCATIDRRLRDDFGIVIRPGTLAFGGLATEDITCADRINVYEMFTLPFAYVRYPMRLNPSDAFTMHLYRTASPVRGSCSAYVPSSQAVQIRDLRQCLAGVSGRADPDFIRIAMFLIHEVGHIITARNPALRTAFANADLPRQDPRCYDRGFIRTYSLRTTNPINESFAEAAALFIGRRKVGRLGTINDFRAECPNTYEWIRLNLYGDRR